MPRTKKRPTFIREWRKHRKLTLEQLGERVDMSAGGLSMLENGKRAYTQDSLEAIADALDTTAGALLTLNPQKPEAVWAWLGTFGNLTNRPR